LENKQIAFSPPDISEEEIRSVSEVLRSGWITTGPKTKEFEQQLAEFVGANTAVCLNSGTAALELVLRVLGVGPGDEVITTPYTYTASASVIQHVGAEIVFVDTAENSFEMDYDKVYEAVNEKTKVIIPVDIAGKMCNYDVLFRIAEDKKACFHPSNEIQSLFNRVVVLSDAAHALGAIQNGLNAGQKADFTCFSFHAVKNVTTAEGGAVVWRNDIGLDDADLYKQFMLYSLHGQSKDALEKCEKGSWEYDIVYPAYKCNMTDITAAFGMVQLARYPDLLERRKQIISAYETLLQEAPVTYLQHYGDSFSSSGHLFLTRAAAADEQERNFIIKKLSEKGISANVHYKPLPMMTAYKSMGFSIDDYPNSFSMYENEISLPLHTQLSTEDVEYICEVYSSILASI